MGEALASLNSRLDEMQTRISIRLDGVEAMMARMSRRFDDLQAQININLQTCARRHEEPAPPPLDSERTRPYLSISGGTSASKLQVMGPQSTDTAASANTEAELVTNEDNCALEESIWDAALLLFLDEQALCSSIFALGVLILNVILQVSFSCVVLVSFSEPEVTSEIADEYVHWRLNIAHQCAHDLIFFFNIQCGFDI